MGGTTQRQMGGPLGGKMLRLKALVLIGLISFVTAAPSQSVYPSCYDPRPRVEPVPCPEPCPPPCPQPCLPICDQNICATPGGNGPVKVFIPTSSLSASLQSVGFKRLSVPGGTFYFQPSPDITIQPPAVLIRPPRLRPIRPPVLFVQPPQQEPITPEPIVVTPPALPQITPPPLKVQPPSVSPIQPPPLEVQPPRPAPVQPPPITINQPRPAPIYPPPVVVKAPTYPSLQLPTIRLDAQLLRKNEWSHPCADPCSPEPSA